MTLRGLRGYLSQWLFTLKMTTSKQVTLRMRMRTVVSLMAALLLLINNLIKSQRMMRMAVTVKINQWEWDRESNR